MRWHSPSMEVTILEKFIIAEIGSVHDGSFGNAMKLIEAAAESGADAVKFQTHIAEKETLPGAPSPSYFQSESRYNYFLRTAFSTSQWEMLKRHTHEVGISFLSSPFSLEAVDLLESIGVEIYKIPSGEVTNLPLLEKVTATGKSILLSSGMSCWEELDRAVAVCQACPHLVVLQCSSIYPCPPEKIGLNVMLEMKKRFSCAVGLSDHSLGVAAPIAAAALGASVIEKHLTFSRRMYGSDAKHSLEPAEFKAMVQSVREVWTMMDSPVDKDDGTPYEVMKRVFEKSIVAARDLKIGTNISVADIAYKKPGNGISADRYKELIGLRLRSSVSKDHMFSWEDFEDR